MQFRPWNTDFQMDEFEMDSLNLSKPSLNISENFDSDFLLEHSTPYKSTTDDYSDVLIRNPNVWLGSRGCEIRHHDCMWAGLCINKEHDRGLRRNGIQVQSKIPAGRSLLISRNTTQSSSSSTTSASQPNLPVNLESDGDSPRPETPQSSSSETEDEEPYFRHDQIMSDNETETEHKAFPVSEITGQRYPVRMKTGIKIGQDDYQPARRETNIKNTLSDHSYHLNHPRSKDVDYLGVQTPSESEEEEIDVVTYDHKSCRPATLPTSFNPAEQQRYQLTINTALKDKPAPRPRGRPPNPNRKKAEVTAIYEPQVHTKRNNRTSQRRATAKAIAEISPSSGKMGISQSRCSSDDEDIEKRSLHNNMERQRRIEIRHLFEHVRKLVPKVSTMEKAPKVAILRHAAEYCIEMMDKEEENLAEISELTKLQSKLKAQVSYLRTKYKKRRHKTVRHEC